MAEKLPGKEKRSSLSGALWAGMLLVGSAVTLDLVSPGGMSRAWSGLKRNLSGK